MQNTQSGYVKKQTPVWVPKQTKQFCVYTENTYLKEKRENKPYVNIWQQRDISCYIFFFVDADNGFLNNPNDLAYSRILLFLFLCLYQYHGLACS